MRKVGLINFGEVASFFVWQDCVIFLKTYFLLLWGCVIFSHFFIFFRDIFVQRVRDFKFYVFFYIFSVFLLRFVLVFFVVPVFFCSGAGGVGCGGSCGGGRNLF